jgi:hypothetical protein
MSDLSRFHHPPWGALLLVATMLLTARVEAASPAVTAGDIFWVNPTASPSHLCRAMLSPLRDEPGSVPFCRAFRQYQVIEVVGAQAQIGIETWIRLEDLTNPTLLLRFDPAARTPASRPQAARSGTTLTASPVPHPPGGERQEVERFVAISPSRP